MVLQENYVKLKRDAEASEVLLLAIREQLAVREGELVQTQQELGEQKGRCSSMEVSMNLEVASRERTERELKTAYLQRDAMQGQLDRCCCCIQPRPVYLTRVCVLAPTLSCSQLTDLAYGVCDRHRALSNARQAVGEKPTVKKGKSIVLSMSLWPKPVQGWRGDHKVVPNEGPPGQRDW